MGKLGGFKRTPLATVVLVTVFGVGAAFAFAAPAFAAGAGYVPPPVTSSNLLPPPPSSTGGPVVTPSLPVTAPSLYYTGSHHHRKPKETYQLVLDSPSGTPGASLTVNGKGCTPEAPVVLTVDRRKVGSATADQAGDFTAPIVVPNVSVGQYAVTASCGSTRGTLLNITLLTDASPGSLAFVALIFFVLAGLILFQLILRPGRRR